MNYKSLIILLSFMLLMPFSAGAQEIIKKGESLNIERCIEIALKMQPNILAATGTVRATESRIGQAKSNYYPQVNWSSSYSRIKSGLLFIRFFIGHFKRNFGQDRRII